MVRVSDHLVVSLISYNPYILSIHNLEVVNELLLKLLAVLACEELGSLAKVAHHLRMMVRLLVLGEGVLIFALLLTHLAVVFMLAESHLMLHLTK